MKVPAILVLLLWSVFPLYGQNIYIYDRDLGDTYPDPVTSQPVGCEEAIRIALDQNGFSYDIATTLPADLNPYDLLFIVMGSYC